MAVVCFAATSCGTAADQRSHGSDGDAPETAPLLVQVDNDPTAIALVHARRREAASAQRAARARAVARARARLANQPPPVRFRRKVDAVAPLRVGFLGDSVAFSLNPSLAAAARQLDRRKHLPFVTAGGFEGPGFGLTADVTGHNDIGPTAPAEAYAHWQDRVSEMIAVDNPDVVLVLLGTWDTIEREPGGRALAPGMPEWRQWYGMLASQFVKTLTSRGAVVVWLEMPCVGRPDLNGRLNQVNAVLHDTWRVAPGRVGFVPLSKVACHGDVPIYQAPGPSGPVTVREADGVHFRPFEAPAVLAPFLVRRFEALLRGVRATPPRNHTT
jgi:hypothetical protein